MPRLSWALLANHRKRRPLTRLGVPIKRLRMMSISYICKGAVLVGTLWQTLVGIGAASDWDLATPQTGINPYADLAGLLGEVYALVEMIDLLADESICILLQENAKDRRYAAAVVAQAVSYLMGFFIAGICFAATFSSTFTTMDQFSEVRVGAGETILLVALAFSALVHANDDLDSILECTSEQTSRDNPYYFQWRFLIVLLLVSGPFMALLGDGLVQSSVRTPLLEKGWVTAGTAGATVGFTAGVTVIMIVKNAIIKQPRKLLLFHYCIQLVLVSFALFVVVYSSFMKEQTTLEEGCVLKETSTKLLDGLCYFQDPPAHKAEFTDKVQEAGCSGEGGQWLAARLNQSVCESHLYTGRIAGQWATGAGNSTGSNIWDYPDENNDGDGGPLYGALRETFIANFVLADSALQLFALEKLLWDRPPTTWLQSLKRATKPILLMMLSSLACGQSLALTELVIKRPMPGPAFCQDAEGEHRDVGNCVRNGGVWFTEVPDESPYSEGEVQPGQEIRFAFVHYGVIGLLSVMLIAEAARNYGQVSEEHKWYVKYSKTALKPGLAYKIVRSPRFWVFTMLFFFFFSFEIIGKWVNWPGSFTHKSGNGPVGANPPAMVSGLATSAAFSYTLFVVVAGVIVAQYIQGTKDSKDVISSWEAGKLPNIQEGVRPESTAKVSPAPSGDALK